MVREWILDHKEDAEKNGDGSKTRPQWIRESSGHTKNLDSCWLAAVNDAHQRDIVRESPVINFSNDKDLGSHIRRGEPISTSVQVRTTSEPIFDENGKFIGSKS